MIILQRRSKEVKMGLGYSVEMLGDSITDKESRHIVKEGLAIAAAYIALRYVYNSVTTKG